MELLVLEFSLSRLGWCSVYRTEACVAYAKQAGTRSKRMHWMDARALRRKDAFRGERPWGDTVCDPWISDRETEKTSNWEGDPPGELTVPQTDTGEQVEYTRALERTMSKELGKMTPELRGANPSTRGLGWANLWSTGCYANSSAGQLSWYGRTAAQREILLYTSSRTRFLNRTSIGERCYNQQEGIYYDETFGPVIKMATEDIKHVALRSPIGIYSTKVMPFGLKNAGATYQRAMTNIFKELLHHEVECYVDDLVLQLE
ncbi:UNVERIFIED_CONTAM: Retrovirus-related Pol polyprotein from transposon [Sesamum calycinum]|uniref:Retrovirus-related Pol polyprotein from transposon n=1 Tax=Sesamum calycinum TaxID=2727403 RepID=A0AAW2K8P2_9LAMI